jgi:isoleucyl-tRNA synthetase
MGAEIVRLWVASVDFREDVVGSEKLMQRIAETYRDIRNKLFRFVLSNLYYPGNPETYFDPQVDAVAFQEMEAVDQFILRRTWALSADVIRYYKQFDFHKIYQSVNAFVISELSAFYLDVVKDRLYTYAPKSRGRRSAQTALWRIGEAMTRLLAPVLSFTCDEVWQYLPKTEGRPASVHMAKFPEAKDVLGNGVPPEDSRQMEDWAQLLTVRDQVLKSLEEARNQKQIGKSLEAQVKVTASDPAYSVLERYKPDLRYAFIVSQVALERGPSRNGTGHLAVEVAKAAGTECERCWNYSTRVGEDPKYPTLCERCTPVVKEIEASAAPVSSNS